LVKANNKPLVFLWKFWGASGLASRAVSVVIRSSLLWRLEQEGVDVADRWDIVGRIAYERRADTAYVFGALHSLLALIGSRQLAAAHDLVNALRASAALTSVAHSTTEQAPDQAKVSQDVGVALAETILAMAEQRTVRVPFATLASRLHRLGGSVAQRDVFLRTLYIIASESGDEVSAARLKALRLRQRHEDRFLHLVGHRQNNRARA
jgi:hypothetical protein